MGIRQAVILAGGFGTRLGELTKNTPKPMLNVGGQPFLDYLVWNLSRYGFQKILMTVGYHSEVIKNHFKEGNDYGIKIEYFHENTPLGTGGAFIEAYEMLDSSFLVLNGDTLFDLNYLELYRIHVKSKALATIALRNVTNVERYGSVIIDNLWINNFSEKTQYGSGVINGGVYVIEREVLQFLKKGVSSLEKDLFPLLTANKRLAGKTFSGEFIDIGIKKSFNDAQKLITTWQNKPAIFFDRDGVLNVDYGYVHKKEQFKWNAGAIDAIKWCNDHGYLVFVVTNQAGIARGIYSEKTFDMLCVWMNEVLMPKGAHIDQFFYCPHHPDENCDCRKPKPGLIEQAFQKWSINKKKSLLVGDKISDVQAADAAGIQGIIYQNGNLKDFMISKIKSF